MFTCYKVANYILSLANEEIGDIISNLKLQKLVYYSQGFHLALRDQPLFNEPIEAWQHGPVVPELYRQFKEYGSGAIQTPKEMNFDIYTEDVKEVLNEVYDAFGQFSAWKLRDMTHDEAPWKDAVNSSNMIITHESMKEYFKTQLI